MLKRSPVLGILAELKFRKLEEIIIRKLKNIIVHWFRYVDDIFAIIKEDCQIRNLISEMNSIDNNIKFTCETENNRKLNYLDVSGTKTENNIFLNNSLQKTRK